MAKESITDGSELTWSPGQPVQSSRLKDSWILELSEWVAVIVSRGVPYAKAIEEGVGPHGPLTLRSEVGGWHSIKLTKAGMSKIVAAATKGLK
jgi:hypothetical protein